MCCILFPRIHGRSLSYVDYNKALIGVIALFPHFCICPCQLFDFVYRNQWMYQPTMPKCWLLCWWSEWLHMYLPSWIQWQSLWNWLVNVSAYIYPYPKCFPVRSRNKSVHRLTIINKETHYILHLYKKCLDFKPSLLLLQNFNIDNLLFSNSCRISSFNLLW